MCGPVAGPSQHCFHNGPQGRGYSGWDERWRVVSRLACHVAGYDQRRSKLSSCRGVCVKRLVRCLAQAPLQRSRHGCLYSLLSHFLKLLTDYRSVEAIDGNVEPIAFFAFHYEVSRTSAASPIAEGERMKVRGFRRERPAA